MTSSRRISAGLFFIAALVAGAANCAAPIDSSDETTEDVGVSRAAITGAVGDWTGFTAGQCVHGVYSFYAARFGISLPGACAAGHDIGICENCGACDIWESPAVNPPASLFNKYAWGSTMPQLYDIVVFPPSGNVYGYGHVAGVDHMTSSDPSDSNSMYVVDSNWYGNEAVCTAVHTVNRVPYGIFRLKSLDNAPPRGAFDVADCDGIGGWSQDPSAPDQAIATDLYFNGPAGDPNAAGIRLSAGNHRDDLCTAIGSCNHGWSMLPPRGAMDGAAHPVFAYGVDTAGGNNPLLGNKSFTCAPPAIPGKVLKRHVASPDVMTSWKLSTFFDLATYDDDKAVKAIPGAHEIPAAPELIQSSEVPDAGIEIVDGGKRRHVVDMDSFNAWRFTADQVKDLPKADFEAYPAGLDWPATPLLVKATGDDAVYLLDALVTEPNGDGGGAPTSRPHHGGDSSGAGTAGGSADGDNPGPSGADNGGCTFGAGERPPVSLAALAFLGLALASRRRR